MSDQDDRIDKLEKELDKLKKRLYCTSIDNRTLLIANATILAGLFILTSLIFQPYIQLLFSNLETKENVDNNMSISSLIQKNPILIIIGSAVLIGISFLGLSSLLILFGDLELAKIVSGIGMLILIVLFLFLGIFMGLGQLSVLLSYSLLISIASIPTSIVIALILKYRHKIKAKLIHRCFKFRQTKR